MQPDNEKIIEAIAAHKVATRKLIQDLIGYGATTHTLDGIVQTLKVLEVCYGQPQQCCMGAAAGMVVRNLARLRSDNNDVQFPEDIEKIIAEAIKEYEARESTDTEN